jgi:hypothetical protein
MDLELRHAGLAVLAILAASLAPGAARAQLCDLTLVAQDESGHRNIPNYLYDARHTAGGHWQITDSNWRRFAPMVDIDLQKWPNALSAPEHLQGQVAGIMRAKLGCLPWMPYNAQLRRDLKSGQVIREASTKSPSMASSTKAALPGQEQSARPGAQISRLTASSDVYNPFKIVFP